jgi:hypothetical protein
MAMPRDIPIQEMHALATYAFQGICSCGLEVIEKWQCAEYYDQLWVEYSFTECH